MIDTLTIAALRALAVEWRTGPSLSAFHSDGVQRQAAKVADRMADALQDGVPPDDSHWLAPSVLHFARHRIWLGLSSLFFAIRQHAGEALWLADGSPEPTEEMIP